MPLPFSLHPLDPRFTFPKPIKVAPIERIRQLEADGNLIIERKRQGHCGLIAVTGLRHRRAEIYSSGINSLTANFPSLVEEIQEMKIPSDTLLAGELVLAVNGIDSDSTFGRLARSKPAQAHALEKSLGPVRLALFNVVLHRGKSVIALPYTDRLDIIREMVARHTIESIDVVQVIGVPHEQAQATVREQRWEGLVYYDKHASSAYALSQTKIDPPRPYGCWKWKPYKEDDFVATGWVPSESSSFKGLVKDLLIAQRDPTTKQLVSWGKVGVGLSMKQRCEYANDKLYPMVFEIQFERRTPNSRLIAAHIRRQRFDKTPEECFSPTD